jgi:hypothetical protein
VKRALFLACALSACGVPEAMLVTVELPQQASDIQSVEVFAVRASKLNLSGTDACDAYFKDSLGEFVSDASAVYSFSSASPQASDLKVAPGKGYVVFARGWNADLKANPDVEPKRVIALGCVSDVTVSANRVTPFDIKMCLLQGPTADPLCPSR